MYDRIRAPGNLAQMDLLVDVYERSSTLSFSNSDERGRTSNDFEDQGKVEGDRSTFV